MRGTQRRRRARWSTARSSRPSPSVCPTACAHGARIRRRAATSKTKSKAHASAPPPRGAVDRRRQHCTTTKKQEEQISTKNENASLDVSCLGMCAFASAVWHLGASCSEYAFPTQLQRSMGGFTRCSIDRSILCPQSATPFEERACRSLHEAPFLGSLFRIDRSALSGEEQKVDSEPKVSTHTEASHWLHPSFDRCPSRVDVLGWARVIEAVVSSTAFACSISRVAYQVETSQN